MQPAALPEWTETPGCERLFDNRLRVFDSEIDARGLGNVCGIGILGGCVLLVLVVDEMNHTKLRRVIWRGFSEMTATDDKVDNEMSLVMPI